MKNNRTKLLQRVRYTLLAGMAGAFLIPQVGFAAPTGYHDVTAGVTVNTSGSTTNISGSAANNLIKWQDYSVANGETVAYDSKNYLNLVTGGNTSTINGTITGGGDIYLVNPNGVIFGKTASVNVGSLHVSTQNLSAVNDAAFTASGTSPINTTAAGLSDVVNMGAITATNVEVVGKSIRFLNAADVSGSVVMHTDTANDGTAHIGYRGTVPTSGYTVNGAAATAADNYYHLVRNTTEFQAMSTDVTKNYMLENDINFGGGGLTPIGDHSTPFTGKFDGNFFQLQNFTITGGVYTAPFGKVSNSRIENVGVTGATVTGDKTGNQDRWAGGLIGYADGTKIKNVYIKSSTVDGEAGQHGGIVGQTVGTTLDSIYSKARIGEGGGVIGRSAAGTVVNDTYSNSSKIAGSTGTELIYFLDPNNGTTIKNTYMIGPRLATNDAGLNKNNTTNTFIVDKSTGLATKFKETPSQTNSKPMTASSTYAGFDINNDGTPGAKWRIYEGRTTPMLTAFMSGTATANYSYRYFNADGSVADTSVAAVKQNNGADVTGLEYNSKYVKIVDNTGNAVGNKSNQVVYSDPVDLNKIHDYVNATTKDFDKTNGVRNAGTKAILWTDQDGPNLRGVNITIDPREVKLTGGNLDVTRVYNGKKSVKDAFEYALTHGGVGTAGFTVDDIATHSVSLNTTSFTADMADKNVVRNADGTYGQKNVTFGGTITFSGDDAKNYTFDNSSISSLTGKVRITPAPLYLDIGKNKAADKIYDGTVNVKDDAMKQTVGTPNIKLRDTIVDGTSDGTRMIDDGGTVDTVSIKNIADPTYTDASGAPQIHVGSHKLQYTNVGLDTTTHPDGLNYDLYYTPNGGSKTKVTDEKLYLDGDIVRRGISRNSFTVYNSDNSVASATKPYDGTNVYTPGTGLYLSSNAGASTNPNEGIVTRDQGHITFQLAGGAYFTNNAGTRTKNVAEATKVAYTAKGHADSHTDTYGGHLLSDYYVLNEDGVTKDPLDGIFSASGAGKITPKTITATIKHSPITKVYDALRAHDKTGDDIITLAGVIAGDTVTNTSTAEYRSKNVVYSGGTPTTQIVDYTAKFSIANAAEAQNYTFSPQATPASATPVTTTTTLTGLGTITPRPITMSFASVSKVYDGTATNTDLSSPTLNDGASGVVLQRDFGASGPTLTGHITSRYGDGTTLFTENPNAGNRSVEYVGFQNTLGTNYTVADKQYGTGTITRRRIDPSSFNVYKRSDNTPATITKVYDGASTYNVGTDVYLSANTAPLGDTGIVSRDFQKVTFALAPSTQAHFTSDAAGQNVTSHVRDARYAAYDIVAATTDPTNHPLSNYTYGPVGNTQNLESLHNARATVAGASITPASLTATTHFLEKVYDGIAGHTDGNQNVILGDRVVSFTGFVGSDATKFNNESAGAYGKDVVLDGHGNPTTKNVTYTMQLSGANADDYRILHPNNASQQGTLTNGGNTLAFSWNVANAARVTPRPVTVNFADVRKTYDGTDVNTSITASSLNDGLNGRVFQKDGISPTSFAANSGIQSRYVDKDTHGNYASAHNAGAHEVEYTGIQGTLGNNYKVESTAYGKGRIDPRRLNPTDIVVRNSDGTIATAEKVYDGKSIHRTPAAGTYLVLPSGGTNGIVSRDAGKISLVLKADAAGHFTSDAAGKQRTSHVSEAQHIAYDVVARTTDPTNNPLSNYTFGADDATARNLEQVNTTNPGHVTAAGRITPREITSVTERITKAYDGRAAHTDNNRNVIVGNDILKFTGMVADETTSDPYVNTSTAVYLNTGGTDDANVAYAAGAVTTKNVKYTARLTGKYADDYKIAGAANTTTTGYGVKTVTAELSPVANAGTITPRKLKVAIDHVNKTYDTDSTNTEVRGLTLTGDPASAVLSDILSDDHISDQSLKNALQGMLTATTPTATSDYGRLSGGNFTTDPHASNGVDHDVRYTNVRGAFRNAFGAQAAGNYTVDDTVYGKGTIAKVNINASDVRFKTSGAEKVYDGTKNVLWKDPVTNIYYGDAEHVSKYITEAKVTLNGKEIDLLARGDIDVNIPGTQYTNANATNGTPDTVKYHLFLKDRNIIISGDNNFYSSDTGTIKRRTLTLDLAEKAGINKIYDGERTLVDKNTRHYTASVNDGAQVSVAAAYADKNVAYDSNGDPAAKQITYTMRINGDAGKNYLLSDGINPAVNAESASGLTLQATGTIAPRTLNLHFENPAQRGYDGTSENTDIVLRAANPLTADNSDGRAALAMREVTPSDFTITSAVKSDYGHRAADGTFTADGSVGDKDVEFRNLAGLLPTAYRGNFVLADKSYATGKIGRTRINANDVQFGTALASKIYDGTTDVLWRKADGTYSGDLKDVRKYITNAYVMVNNRRVELQNDIVLDPNNKPQYTDPNVTPSTGVDITYTFSLDNKNFDIDGTNHFSKTGKGTITPRDLQTQMPSHIYKQYDGRSTFTQNNSDYAAAIARENLMPLAERDKAYLDLSVIGTYHSPNATVDTEADAKLKPGLTKVDYALTLGVKSSADPTEAAKRLQNYTIMGHPTTGTVTNRAADIYRKELTASIDALPDKIYDGKRRVDGLTAGMVHYTGFVGTEGTGFTLTNDALQKIKGKYDTADVSRDAHGNPTHKAITYEGVNEALRAMTGTAENYRVGAATNYSVTDDKLSYVPSDEKGRIVPRTITSNDILRGVKLSLDGIKKTYDGTTVVKYKEDASAAALHNYLEHAYIMDGSNPLTDDDGNKIDIKDSLSVDPTRTHYADKNVNGELPQGVTYGLDYTPTAQNRNLVISGGALDYTGAQGKILRKEVTANILSPLTKEYDALRDVAGVAKNNNGQTVQTGDSLIRFDGLTGNDGVNNLSTARYLAKDAGTGLRVDYDARLDSDNYRIVNAADLHSDDNEITKRRLNLAFDDVRKEYDATPNNGSITARISNTASIETLTRDGMAPSGTHLEQFNATNTTSHYGRRSGDGFTPDGNAGTKDVRYLGIGDVFRQHLGNNAKNYDFDEVGWGTGMIDRAKVTRRDFTFDFGFARKTYDGTNTVLNARDLFRGKLKGNAIPEADVLRVEGKYLGEDAGDYTNRVKYEVTLNTDNYEFTDGTLNPMTEVKDGAIDRRRLRVGLPQITPTKTYDKTIDVVGKALTREGGSLISNLDDHMRFVFVDDENGDAIVARDRGRVTPHLTAQFRNKNVAWNGNQVANKPVDYTYALRGKGVENYDLVDDAGNSIATLTNGGTSNAALTAQTMTGEGRINPYEIVLTPKEKTVWINDGLPQKYDYEGTPQGKNYRTLLGEILPGEIRYDAPGAKLRWGNYPIVGEYVPADGDTVYQNYRFRTEQRMLHVGPYIPDYEYYKAITQTSKMIPDEYAYENASLDRQSHFGRKADAEVTYDPPSINTVKDGTDIMQTGIRIADETVFSLVNEVFGAR
ncbi:filamentous hemagglutinin family N-terminal domain protein [Selenomonas sp. FOBRC6]|uniref:filamentous hemagglutinin N-terminal domain-containing protein n=1 Tax=Selenomonas sp. FOBRC6 TaxID=936572 RepID=UPI00027819A4|nr:filamentous hemagglutinin N-terminal domain-containing protein [Selenomonas sp. FOBRC6]EJO22697.1 filamentous hemagglutinin family N-terminal domain protein [Selenomonas sp. FOBRC6]